MTKSNPGQFVREVRQEVSKVTWPTRKETMQTTGIVFVILIFILLHRQEAVPLHNLR